jgi:hypothetical protein
MMPLSCPKQTRSTMEGGMKKGERYISPANAQRRFTINTRVVHNFAPSHSKPRQKKYDIMHMRLPSNLYPPFEPIRPYQGRNQVNPPTNSHPPSTLQTITPPPPIPSQFNIIVTTLNPLITTPDFNSPSALLTHQWRKKIPCRFVTPVRRRVCGVYEGVMITKTRAFSRQPSGESNPP